MNYLSVCSGYGGAELAFEGLGWQCAGVAEIDPAARTVLKHRWPEVKNFGDFTKIKTEDIGPIDALVGGTPCQSFSVAGLRGGLGDERGNLSLEFLRLADRTRPRWILWENVPGVFSATSHIAPDPRPPQDNLDGDNGPEDGTEVVVEDQYDSNEDHAFSCFLAGLSELGYGYAYRTLNAEFFGVPQRRRRVFVVGHLGDWRPAAAVLFERHCLSGHPAPRREAREGVAGPVNASTPSRRNGGSNPTADQFVSGTLRGGGREDGVTTSTGAEPSFPQNDSPGPYWDGSDTADTLDASNASKQQAMPEKRRFQAVVTHALRADGFDASEDGTRRGTPLVACPLTSNPYGDHESRESLLVAQTLTTGGTGERGFNDPLNATLIPIAHTETLPTMQRGADSEAAHSARSGDCKDQYIVPVAFESRYARNGRGAPSEVVPPLKAQSGQTGRGDSAPMVCFDETQVTSPGNYSNPQPGESCHPLASGARPPAVAGMQVRRLTPRECEALQGLPQDHTLVPYHGQPLADGPRYKMIGNGFAVPVVKWLAERIQMVEELVK